MAAMANFRPFGSVLVANRGEIALRIIGTANALGLRTIAVYSQADAGAPHVRAAGDARLIGAAPPGESYLSIERIIAAAKATGAEAIHPGYGFLSENADFARACAEAGLIFVGPPADAIEAMGNKAAAKRLMLDAGVPCVPGYQDAAQDYAAFTKAAADIGYPVMVKAAAGGGGRGMRLVTDPGNLTEALSLARSEAENAFGSGELILEKAIQRPRHVEIQVFADCRGNTIHLGERDCSVQRRHQKVVEEAPSPAVSPQLRKKMGAAAVQAAKAVGYVGAGTVEFLLGSNEDFYFLEMNTRLQVEHPVTEMVTGLDLVAMQFAVAAGEPLPLSQDDVAMTGHAIEVRLYAEDPSNGFLPASGRIALWQPPGGDDVRVDAGIATGQTVPPDYDPMLAKIIARGASREQARRRLVSALDRTVLFGPANNRDFLIAVVSDPLFASGGATTAFLDEAGLPAAQTETGRSKLTIAAAVLMHVARRDSFRAIAGIAGEFQEWSTLGKLSTRQRLDGCGRETDIVLVSSNECYTASLDGDDGVRVKAEILDAHSARLTIDDAVSHCRFLATSDGIHVAMDGRSAHFRDVLCAGASGSLETDDHLVVSPMHGRLVSVDVKSGANVEKGATVAVLEAMKMQHRLVAEMSGRIASVSATAGSQIAAGDIILEIEQGDE